MRQALEAALDPRPGGLCIAVTESGGTRATLLAVEAARDAGSATAAITANPGGAVISTVDVVMVTPQRDKSWCHTVAYTSAILAELRSPPRSPRWTSTRARSPAGWQSGHARRGRAQGRACDA